jgi:glycosyltransferase involved in cell wall biosynthesis
MINVSAPFTTETSYGIVALNLCKALNDLGQPLRLIPLNNNNFEYVPELEPLSRGSICRDDPSIKLFHQFDLALNVGRPAIGYPIFELDNFSEEEIWHLKSCDHVIVCSDWAKQVVYDTTDIPENRIHKVRLGVDDRFTPMTVKKQRPAFLHVGKVEVRKNSKLIVDLFAEEFKNDDVELWLSWHNVFVRDMEEWNEYAVKKLGDKVKILPRLQHDQIPTMIQHSDAVISLSSAEGWNLPLLEAMACGKHVIATRNTAQTEFCNDDNSLLVDTPEKVWARDGIFFVEKIGKWHKIDDEARQQFKAHLRTTYDSVLRGSINEAGIETAKEFSWNNAAQQLISVLKSINE